MEIQIESNSNVEIDMFNSDFEIKIPKEVLRGPQGPQGPQGPPGPQGETGTVDLSNYYNKQEIDEIVSNEHDELIKYTNDLFNSIINADEVNY